MLSLPVTSSSHGLDDRKRIAIEMLIAGVAFKETGTRWNVYSHEGDELGSLSTFLVSEVTHLMKKAGYKPDDLSRFMKPGEEYRSFGHGFPNHQVEEIMARRAKNVKHLQ